jgi:2-keto-3-deoxy-L-rhamnonate aldolase RhmA
VAHLVWAGRGLPAIPLIRVPDATKGDIQKATDLGALGTIVPMVDDVAKAVVDLVHEDVDAPQQWPARRPCADEFVLMDRCPGR